MAAKANTRKRKHSEHVDEEVVPKKQQKKSETPKKQKIKKKQLKNQNEMENNGQENSNDETIETLNGEDAEMEEVENTIPEKTIEKEKPIRFSKEFKMMEFRNKLRGLDFITELRHFLHLLEQKPRFAAKYIEKRGKPLELAETLERIDKTNVLHIGYVCQALQAILMEILSNQQSHMESAVSACRYFLKTQNGVVEQLLESPITKHRRIALKLLTAIVCVDPQMGRQVLAAFNLLTDVRKITQLLSHNVHEFREEETVRKCYIHFVLSFLVEGNTLLVQNILDRSSLIQALVFGLLYDDQLTVCLVLKTLKKYVLESVNISKTKKIHVFNLECCKCFARLYDWLGPKVYFAKFAGKHLGGQAGGHVTHEKIQSMIENSEKAAVEAVVHEFLLTLLSSRKHGIAFEAVTHFRQRHNTIQGKVIGFVPKPWNSELKTELVVRTLEACPDLARQTMRHFSSVIKPLSIGTKEWPQAAGFLAKIIDVLQPKILQPALVKLTLTDFAYWIKDVCLPLDTLTGIRVSNMLMNEDFNCRVATHRLLLSMFLQYSNYLDAAMKREESKGSGGSSLRRFKFDLYNHILSHFPAVDLILRSLHATTSLSDSFSASLMLEHFHVTLDLILAICKRNRAFIDKQGTILDYLKLIRPLYTGEVDDGDEGEENNQFKNHTLAKHGDILLEIKAVKTILLLSPNSIKPGKMLFGSVLASFIKGLVYGSPEVQREASALLREIFKNTGIFEAGLLEIDLWLEALRLSPPDTVDVVTQVLQQVLQVTHADVDLPSAIESTTSNEAALSQLFENIEKGHYVQAYVETLTISKLLPLIFKGVELVKPLNKYLELVCWLLFHYYPSPAYVLKLYEMKFESQKPYMEAWLEQTTSDGFEPAKLPKIAASIPQIKQMQSAFLHHAGESSFEAIFGTQTDEAFEITIKGKELHLSTIVQNERILLIHIQQLVFLITELTQKQQLMREQAEFAADCLTHFLAILRQLMEQEIEQSITYTDDGSKRQQPSTVNSILRYIFDARLAKIDSAQLCNETNANYLRFLSLLAESCNTLPDFDDVVHNFRLKIVNAVAIDLETRQKVADAEFVQMVESFRLSSDNCLELLRLLCDKLKYSDFFEAEADSGGYQRSFFFDLLSCVLKRLSTLAEAVSCSDLMKPLAKFYIKMQEKTNGELNLEDMEFALLDFFTVMHQFLPLIAKKVFRCIFEAPRVSKAGVKLAALLLERQADELTEMFLEILPLHTAKRELVYPLLEVAFEHNFEIDATLLNTIYQEYRNGFMKSIEKPQKAGVIYKDYANCSVALVAACMPETECLDFVKKRLQFNDPSELYQLQLMQAIYEKAFKSSLKLPMEEDASNTNNTQTKMFVNFLHLHVQLLSNDLKRQAMSLEKLELFAYNMQRWCEQLPLLKSKPNFESLVKSQNWTNFCKSCLKLCMQTHENETEEAYGLLLQLLAYLCDQLYDDAADEADSTEAASLFQMICTHSKFYEIMLTPKPNSLKTEVLHLLYVLAKKSPQQALPQLEMPLLLGAYQARLSHADRYALAMLQLYERHHAAAVQAYRPFIWGESAISCYALREDDANQRAALTQQETTISLVMSLIERHQCEYTLENFPIWRKLDAGAQMPDVKFSKPKLKPFKYFGSNRLEQHVEFCFLNDSNGQASTKPDPRLSPAADEIYYQCYDPAFFVPLMSNCFAPGTAAHTARPVQNGLLALCFAGLSSHDKEMRQAAGLVQLRYRVHFEQSKFFEKPLWIQAYDNIQAGLADLSDAWRGKHKTHSKQYVPVPRVPYMPTLFIARTFNITNDPTNLLYKHLTFYLRLKNAFNFQTIPEFNVFFHSPEVEHQTFRHFILEIIRQGLKSSADLFLLVSTSTFKVLLAFYGGPMSNLETNLLLLSLLADCVKIPASAKLMIEHVGMLPWLKTVIVSLEFFHFDIIERIIDIITQLWYAMSATAADFHNYNFLCFELFGLLHDLLPLLSARINVAKFARLLNVLQKTASIAKSSRPHGIVSSEQLDKLISCAQKYFGALVQPLKNLKTLGSGGAASHESYCAQLFAANVEPEAIVALSSLRAFVIEWTKSQKTQDLNISVL